MFNWKGRVAVILVSGLGIGMFYGDLMPVYQSSAVNEEMYAYIQDESVEAVPEDSSIQYTETVDVLDSREKRLPPPHEREQVLGGDDTIITDYGTSRPATPEETERLLEQYNTTIPIEKATSNNSTTKEDISSFNYVHGLIGSALGWVLTCLLDSVKMLLLLLRKRI